MTATSARGDAVVLAVDVGGTHVRSAAVAQGGAVSHRSRRRTPPDARDLVQAVLACVHDTASQLRLSGGLTPDAVVVAAPGPLDRTAGAIEASANLGAPRVALLEPLRAALSLPIVVEKDVDVAAFGEREFGAARGADDFAYVTVSTGIGAAIVLGGRLVTGAHGLAGEIGHAPVELDGPPCACGNRGCLETLAGGAGIARAARAAVTDGAGGALAQLDDVEAIDVAHAAAAGDAAAEAIITRARAAFAAGMVSLVNAFDPALIIVGGGVARGLGEPLLEDARQAVARHAYGAAARATIFRAAALGDDAGLAGAAAVVRAWGV
jgi:glucokinase